MTLKKGAGSAYWQSWAESGPALTALVDERQNEMSRFSPLRRLKAHFRLRGNL
jgi:hypothetical protein